MCVKYGYILNFVIFEDNCYGTGLQDLGIVFAEQ